MKKAILRLLLPLSFVLLSGSAQAQTSRPASIDLEPFALFLRVGETGQASAKVYDQDGTEILVPIAWISAPNSCASVDVNGKVTAVAVGECRIGAIVASDTGIIIPRTGLVVTVGAVLTRKVAWPATVAAQNQVLDDQWAEHYRFVRILSGKLAEFESVR
jgi:uncharacterized protein YjdB